jgi:hypothetical protein
MTLEDLKIIANKQPKKRIYLRKINEGESEYWQDLVNKSNSFEDVFKLYDSTKTHFPKRSKAWLYKYLDLPFVLSDEERRKEIKKQRIVQAEKYAKSLTFIDKIISWEYPEMGETKISYVCKEGHFHSSRMLRNLKSCSVCSSKKQKQKTIERRIQREQEKKEQKEEQKEKEFSDRLKRVDEFFKNNEWKNYSKQSQWPIYKDCYYLRQKGEYGEFQEIHNSIMYFEYRTSSAVPPIKPKENHFYCRHCREEKHISETRGLSKTGDTKTICVPCAKKYRSENYAEIERQRMKDKYHSDEVYRIGRVVGAHLYHILKGKFNKIKDKSWEEIVGLSKQDFFDFILSKCKPEWNMDNYGVTWVLQHIVPRDWAEEPDDAYLLNYYKNIMPWGFSDNAALSNNIEPSQLNEWHRNNKRIKELLTKNKI